MPTITDAVTADAKNIAVIGEGPVEEWVATKGGGFVRAHFDLPALLFDSSLLHLYDALLHLELEDLWRRYEADRVSFLAYLKDDVGLASLADRQHFANALARTYAGAELAWDSWLLLLIIAASAGPADFSRVRDLHGRCQTPRIVRDHVAGEAVKLHVFQYAQQPRGVRHVLTYVYNRVQNTPGQPHTDEDPGLELFSNAWPWRAGAVRTTC
jgi:hypothetical protein